MNPQNPSHPCISAVNYSIFKYQMATQARSVPNKTAIKNAPRTPILMMLTKHPIMLVKPLGDGLRLGWMMLKNLTIRPRSNRKTLLSTPIIRANPIPKQKPRVYSPSTRNGNRKNSTISSKIPSRESHITHVWKYFGSDRHEVARSLWYSSR